MFVVPYMVIYFLYLIFALRYFVKLVFFCIGDTLFADRNDAVKLAFDTDKGVCCFIENGQTLVHGRGDDQHFNVYHLP